MKQVVGWLVVSIALLASLSGCGPTPVADPLAVMLDRDRDPGRRLAAAKQLGNLSDLPDARRAVAVMYRVLWSDAQPTALRLWSMDRLIEYDQDAFWAAAREHLREVDLLAVRKLLIDRAVEHGDPGFTVALVRSYAQQSRFYTDDQPPAPPAPPAPPVPPVPPVPPERAAIEALNPGVTVEQAVWEVFVSDDETVTTAARVDAWVLMHRLVGADQARGLLLGMDSREPVILDLKAARWLSVLPVNREAVLWLMQVRSQSGGAYWERAQRSAGRLTDKQREGLELRHLPTVMMAGISDPGLSKGMLLSRVAGLIGPGQGTVRTEVGAALGLPSESLADHAESLCFADLMTIELLLDALADRALVAGLFMQADRDLVDRTSEHGGVLVGEGGRVVALAYPPEIRLHDLKFYSSDALIRRMYTGLAHYHFHAQQFNNASYAGPGAGDLGFVERLRASAVVFTFLDRDTLGVDYYQPGGVVVDLGTIKR